MKMLGVASGRIVLASCVLFASCLSVAATCQELEQCFTAFGANVRSLSQDPVDVVDLLCQRQYLLTDCYAKFAGCPRYKSYADFIPNKNEIQAQFTIICKHQDEYKKAVMCVRDTVKSMSRRNMQRTVSCSKQFIQASGRNMTLKRRCTLTEQMISCSDFLRSVFVCSAKLVHILSDNGIDIPCISVYRSLTSGSEPLVSSMIVMSCYVIATLTKLF